MKNIIFKALLLSLIIASCKKNTEVDTVKLGDKIQLEESVRRGEYLVGIMDCAACHTPKLFTPNGPVLDESRLFSGFNSNNELPKLSNTELELAKKWVLFSGDMTSSVGPWGISYTANITSDDTGIGTWSFEQFERAIRKGKYKGLENGRPLLPPMPWQAYKDLSETDLRAIFDFLKSTKPIENIVPPPTPLIQN
ncbi:diheme cytochrome c-553 [Mariniflexile gromovii]|uniref:Diheme cytochrome c-553 n=1 Tax=Mariniflexile gromovii TaxID=362523 RepID=A0ABS4BWS5_9FLAO|nr:diheme cytochrome c-553 [Mariniflexile gromovii]MBP0905043.1 diheme cytochrome c-553 [Mariniflexile gromovii]